MGKFSYNNGCSKFERAKRDFRVNFFFCYVILERSRACMHAMEEFGRDCCIRGYHVYKETWRAAIGEESLGSTATDHLRDLAVCSSNRS